jgi:hypothetical protein
MKMGEVQGGAGAEAAVAASSPAGRPETAAQYTTTIGFDKHGAVKPMGIGATVGVVVAACVGGALNLAGIYVMGFALSVGAWPLAALGAAVFAGGVLFFRRRWGRGGWAGPCPVCGETNWIKAPKATPPIGADCHVCKARFMLKNSRFVATPTSGSK